MPNKESTMPFVLLLYIISTIYIIFNFYIIRMIPLLDEVVVTFLAIYGIYYTKLLKNREVRIVFAVFSGYLIYSSFLHINVPVAVVYDFIIFLKPFICFYVAFTMSLSLSDQMKKNLRKIYLFFGLLLSFFLPFIDELYDNTSGYYHGCIFCATSYLIFSNYRKKDWIIALLILTPGLLSIRAKFFTIYILYIYIAFFLKSKTKFNVKWIIISAILLFLAIYVNREKFLSYFVYGIEDGQARSFQYYYALEILKDYFPFGSGFGTYATEGAAKYYSPLYSILGIDNVWGMREVDYNTDADFLKDTFYPALAQFGIVGVCLFFLFWLKRWKEGKLLTLQKYKLFLFIFWVEMVQNIADNSFTGPFGVPLMMLLGFLLHECKSDIINNKINKHECFNSNQRLSSKVVKS